MVLEMFSITILELRFLNYLSAAGSNFCGGTVHADTSQRSHLYNDGWCRFSGDADIDPSAPDVLIGVARCRYKHQSLPLAV